jgi:uncharacterized protein involved in exopolysaccharide biosynthesis
MNAIQVNPLRVPGITQPGPLALFLEEAFRRRVVLGSAFTVCAVLVLGYCILLPHTFESETVFLVSGSRATSPAPTADAPEAGADSAERSVADEVELLSERSLYQDMAQRIWPREAVDPVRLNGRTQQLMSAIRVEPIPKTSMIRAALRTHNKYLAGAALPLLIDLARERLIRTNDTPATYDFFARQADQAATQLHASEKELARFRQAKGISAYDQQRDVYIARAADFDAQARSALATEAETESRLAALRASHDGAAPRIATQEKSSPNSFAVERMNTMLAELETRRVDLAARYQLGNRMLTSVDKQIELTRKALAEAKQTPAIEQTTEINPVAQDSNLEMARSEVKLKGLRSLSSSLLAQASDYRKELARLEDDKTTEASLQRAVKHAEAQYELLVRRRENAKLARDLSHAAIANVSIAEPPTRPVNPSNYASGVVIAFSVGTLGVLVAPLFTLLLRRTVAAPWELEALLDRPVLACVGTTATPEMNRHRAAIKSAEIRLSSRGEG